MQCAAVRIRSSAGEVSADAVHTCNAPPPTNTAPTRGSGRTGSAVGEVTDAGGADTAAGPGPAALHDTSAVVRAADTANRIGWRGRMHRSSSGCRSGGDADGTGIGDERPARTPL